MPALSNGRLVELFVDYPDERFPFCAYYPSRQVVLARPCARGRSLYLSRSDHQGAVMRRRKNCRPAGAAVMAGRARALTVSVKPLPSSVT